MDFKKQHVIFTVLVSIIFFFVSCSDEEKSNTHNTFYVELVNFNNDSLKQNISEKIFGKVSYYKNTKLEIISVNYLTEYPEDIHYFKNADELGKKIKPETKKIRLEFGGAFTSDSITYSLQKFMFMDNHWKKISDMGFIKANNTTLRTREFAVDQYGKQILKNIVEYTYN